MTKKSKINLKKIIKHVVLNSFKEWKIKKLKKIIDTKHIVLDIIAPKERKISTIIQSLQTSMGMKLWENLIKELAKENGYEIIDKKNYKRPDYKGLHNLVNEWRTKRDESKTKLSLDKYKKDLIKQIKKIKNREKTKKLIPLKGYNLDIWLKKDDKNFLLEIKSPHLNAANGSDFSYKLMMFYHNFLFWNPDSEVKAFICIPYNPFDVKYEVAEKGRIDPLILNEDILVDNNFWQLITGKKEFIKKFEKTITKIEKEGKMYKELKDVIDIIKPFK